LARTPSTNPCLRRKLRAICITVHYLLVLFSIITLINWTYQNILLCRKEITMAEQQSVDIFEVFKLGAIKKTELEALPLDEAKKRFVRLVPVTSTGELKNATAVASVPPPSK
jgi:hypothetical protein